MTLIFREEKSLLPVFLLPLHMKKLITLIALLLLPFAAGYPQEDRDLYIST